MSEEKGKKARLLEIIRNSSGRTFLNEWTVTEYLGRNCGGDVFKIIKHGIPFSEQESALKIIKINHAENIESFLTDIKSLDKIQDVKNIVKIEDFCHVRSADSADYILLRTELLQPVPPLLSQSETIRMAKDICMALKACHAENIVHGNIKPSGIFRAGDNTYKLGNFFDEERLGLDDDTCGGKQYYEAPETIFMEEPNSSCDIYSLGMTMYSVLNKGITEHIQEMRIAGEKLPAITGISSSLMTVIQKMCEFCSEDRYHDAQAVINALEAAEAKIAFGGDTVIQITIPHKEEDKTTEIKHSEAADEPPEIQPEQEVSETLKTKLEKIKSETKTLLNEPEKKKLVMLIAAIAIASVAFCFGILTGLNLQGKSDSIKIDDVTSEEPAISQEISIEEDISSEITIPPVTVSPINSDLKVGDYITLGNYPQSSKNPEPIEWVVLDVNKDENKALVLSRCCLDCKPYNREYLNITWAESTLRKWLNNDFLNQAFSAEEQQKIQSTANTNPDNGNGDGGFDTIDKIFCLGKDDYIQFVQGKSFSFAHCTNYAVMNGAYTETNDNGRLGWWWLRSPGDSNFHALLVKNYDQFSRNFINDFGVAVRPACYISF